MRIDRVWACFVIVTLALGMWATMNSSAFAVSASCTSLNGSSYTVNADGTFTVNAGEQFTFVGGEVINVSATLPAGARARIFINGTEVDFDNSAGVAARDFTGSVTIPNGGPFGPDTVSIIASGVGVSFTINFTCADPTAAVTPAAATPAVVAETPVVEEEDNSAEAAVVTENPVEEEDNSVELAAAAAATAAAEAAAVAELATIQQSAATVDHSVDGLVQGITSGLGQGGDPFNLLGSPVAAVKKDCGDYTQTLQEAQTHYDSLLNKPVEGTSFVDAFDALEKAKEDFENNDCNLVSVVQRAEPITPVELSDEELARLECGDLQAAVASAAARLNAAKGLIDFGAAKVALEKANAALRAANCPGAEPVSVQVPVVQRSPTEFANKEKKVADDSRSVCDDLKENLKFFENEYDRAAVVTVDEWSGATTTDYSKVKGSPAEKDYLNAKKAYDDANCDEIFAAVKAAEDAKFQAEIQEEEDEERLIEGNVEDIREKSDEELAAAIVELRKRLRAAEDTLRDNQRILARDLEDGASSGTMGLSNDVDAAADRVQDIESSIAGHLAEQNARSNTSNYAPATSQTSTKHFDKVINLAHERKTRRGKSPKYLSKFDNSRFQGMSLNPILNGKGFNGKFHFGDRSGPNPWVIFLNTSATIGGDNQSGADRATQAWNIALGGQVRVNHNTLVGLTGGFKRGTVKSKATNTTLDGDYASIGVSVTRKLFGSAMLSASASYTNGQNDVDLDGATGSFDVDVYSANASFSNARQLGLNTLATSLGASYNHVERDAYTDSNGLSIFGSNVESANFSAAATLSRAFRDVGKFASITPSVGISGNYNYRETLTAALVNGVTANQLGLGATLSTGLAMKFDNGVSANLSASYGLFQDDVQNWSVTGALVFPLY